MAQVTLQVLVKDEQVKELQARIDKLDNRKITIQTDDSSLKTFNTTLSRTKTRTENLSKAQKDLKEKLEETGKAIQDENEKLTTGSRAMTDNIKAQKEQVKVHQQVERAAKQSSKAGEEHAKATEKQSLAYKILGRSVDSFILRMTAYRAVYAGIRAITNGFTEALQTLKAVDDELVTVRKVTGFDAYQMAGVESQAYEVASRYGSNAADYVSGVASFARAGYKELSGDLAELAQKTQIVGDTTADTAQQFLLSVDAAYKYNGSISALQRVLDGANEIDNKYATSIEKIAEGMGIVAPVAAQMHVGVDELAASIGTITAVTQRTGTETARALRALFLNIVGDTKTEIDEGVTWTTGEIEGLKDVIKIYAKDAYDAAQATGSIIDPMKAMEGLSKSLKDGVLTEAQLMEMVSDIGGKLRTSQLLALINNWDMYESMLNDYRNAAGSADKEIENAMDSWTRKSNVLKNTWTEFVKTGLDSAFFKDALDAMTSFVERLGTLPGTLARIIPFVTALKLSSMAKQLKDVNEESGRLIKFMDGIGVSSKGLSIAAAAVTALGVAWSVYSYIQEDAKRKHEEQVAAIHEQAEAAKANTDKIVELYKELSTAKEGSDEFASSAKNLADTLGKELPSNLDTAIAKLGEYTEAQIRANAAALNADVVSAEGEFISANRNSALQGAMWGGAGGNSILNEMWGGLLGNRNFYGDPDFMGNYRFVAEDVETVKAYRAEIEKIVEKTQEIALQTGDDTLLDSDFYKRAVTYLRETSDAFDALNSAMDAVTYNDAAAELTKYLQTVKVDTPQAFSEMISSFRDSKEYSDELKDALVEMANARFPELIEATERASAAINNQTNALFSNQAALKDDATAEKRLTAAKKDAEAAARRLIPALFDESGQLTATGKAALQADSNLASLVNSELQAQQAAAKANYSAVIAQIAMIGDTAAMTTVQLANMASVFGLDWSDPIAKAQLDGMKRTAQLKGTSVQAQIMSWAQSYIRSYTNFSNTQIGSIAPYVPPSAGGSGGGSSGSHSGSGSHSSSSASTEDKRLTALKDRVTLLKSELALLQAQGASDEKQIAKMKEIQDALHNQADYMRSIHADQADINGLSVEWYNYQDKITDLMDEQAEAAQKQADAMQAVLDAQIALDNALRNNRTTRYYNAETGQWEYGADAGTVEKAREDLNKALEAAGISPESWAMQYSLMNAAAMADSIRHTDGIFRPSYGDVPNIPRGGVTTNNLGGNNYGNTYNIAGVTLTEDQARGTSVYELVRMSRQLAIYGNNY